MGRLAAGEAFAYRRNDSTLTVRDEAGNLLFAEHALLMPSQTLRDAMGGRGALSTIYAFGIQPNATTADRLTNATQCFDLAGWSVLPNSAGIVAKALVESASQGEGFARACLTVLKTSL
jgi:urease accessory protein UreH